MPRPPENFTTARLVARPPRREDAAAVFAAYASDPVATHYLSFPVHTRIEPVAEFLQARAEGWASNHNHNYGYLLNLRGIDTPIGAIGVELQNHQAMLSYVLARTHWGQGLMTEAVRWMVDWALAQPEIYRVWAFCDAANAASARVMEKAGMTREGILRRWHVAPNIGPEPRDCIVCARVK